MKATDWYMKIKKLKIRIATSEEDRERVYHQRYEIYFGEMGVSAFASDHDHRSMSDELDQDPGETILMILNENDELLGTMRFGAWQMKQVPESIIDSFKLHPLKQYENLKIVDAGKAMINRGARGADLMALLGIRMIKILNETNRLPDIFLCFSFPYLVPHYIRLGFRLLAGEHLSLSDGIRITYIALPFDKELIKDRRAWYVPIVLGLIKQNTKRSDDIIRERNVNLIKKFLNSLEKKVFLISGSDKYKFDPVFHKTFDSEQRNKISHCLSIRAIRRFASLIIKIEENQIVLAKNIKDIEMFYIVEGEFAIMDNGVILKTLKEKSFFGQYALFLGVRTANAVALKPSIVISLHTSIIKKILHETDNVTLQLMFMLAKDMVGRPSD